MENRNYVIQIMAYAFMVPCLWLTVTCCDRSDKRIERGALNLELGDYTRARALFEAVVDEDPASASGRLGLGKALLQQYSAHPGDSALLNDCLTQLEATRTLAPGEEVEKLLSVVWFKRANHLLTGGDTLAALRALSRSTSLDPASSGPVNLAGILYFHRGDAEKALNLFRKVVAVDSGSVSGYFNTGMVHWAAGDYERAYDSWFRAAQHAPDDREILEWAAAAKRQCGRGAP